MLKKKILNKILNKKAFWFSLDALLASMLLLAGIVAINNFYFNVDGLEQHSFIAQDSLNALNSIKIKEINNVWVKQLVNNGLADGENTLLMQISTYWANNETSLAQNLTNISLGMFSENFNLNITLGDDVLFSKGKYDNPEQVIVSSRMISGIKQGKTLKGSTSTAYLKRVRDKKDFQIGYFGGFVGQGNISILLKDIPNDVTPSDIREILFKIDTVSDFDLYINGIFCTTLNSNNELMKMQIFDVTNCNGSISSDNNTFTLIPKGSLGDAYVAGGLVKVSYVTDTFNEEGLGSNIKRYYFPKIDGIINLYDGIDILGVTNNWFLNLSFTSNYTTFMRLGNNTLFSSSGSMNEQNIILSSSNNLSWAPGTIPLRLGTSNFTNVTMIQSGQPADTMLVTDVSGSMDDCGEEYTGPVCKYDCKWWWFTYTMSCTYSGTCNNEECGSCNSGWTDQNYRVVTDTVCNRSRLEIAQDANKLAVNIMLNVSGNRAGLTTFYSSIRDFLGLTSDENLLDNTIDGYYANGGTCICCGINRAKDELATASTNKKFMIVLGDGDANYYCSNFNDYSGSSESSPYTLSKNSTIEAGKNACNNENITVYTIGMGEGLSADGIDTLKRTACNESLFFDASNSSMLEDIYKNISDQILLIANFSAQILEINGTYVAGHLNPDSYIEFNYTPLVEEAGQNEITVNIETDQLSNCTSSFNIPNNLRILDAFVTSYSGPYWTYFLKVNNNVVFNLSDYSNDFVSVGDPFLLNIPPNFLVEGNNNITLLVADNNKNITNCSFNNTIIYTAAINSTVPRSDVLENAEGCNWYIEFEDGHFLNATIPSTYLGTNNCNYTNNSISYDPVDAYDYSVFRILKNLDYYSDGKVLINLNSEDLEIIVTIISDVPYLWGPSLVNVKVWK